MRPLRETVMRGIFLVSIAGATSDCDGVNNKFQPPVSNLRTSIEAPAFPEAIAEKDRIFFRGLIEDFFKVENNPRLSVVIDDPSLSNGLLLKVRKFEYDKQIPTKTTIRREKIAYSLNLPDSSGLKNNIILVDVYLDSNQKINRVTIRYNLAELAHVAPDKDGYTNKELIQMAGLVVRSPDMWIDNKGGHIRGKRVKEDGLSAFGGEKGQYTEYLLLPDGSGVIKRYYYN